MVAGVEAPPDYHAAVGFQQQDDEVRLRIMIIIITVKVLIVNMYSL